MMFRYLSVAACAAAFACVAAAAEAQSRRAAALASAPSAASMREQLKKRSAPSNDLLFGTHETKSDNFEPFSKWTGAVDKMEKERANLEQFKVKFAKWLAAIDSLRDKDKETQIDEINKLMNQADYVQDQTNWGISDYWASPGEFLSKFGDCEDYAIAKYMALKYLGFDADEMRVVAVKDMNLKVGHAILAVYLDDHIVILDNQIKIVVDSRKIRHYQPVYSINEHAWWRHRARAG